MTVLDHTRNSSRGFGSMLSGFVASVVSWNDQRVTRNALSLLTDRELDDIGLVRGDLDSL